MRMQCCPFGMCVTWRQQHLWPWKANASLPLHHPVPTRDLLARALPTCPSGAFTFSMVCSDLRLTCLVNYCTRLCFQTSRRWHTYTPGCLLSGILFVLNSRGLWSDQRDWTSHPPKEIPDLNKPWHYGWQGFLLKWQLNIKKKNPNRGHSAQLENKDTKPFKHNLCTFMALYNNIKDCCVCKYISIIRHFSECIIGIETPTLHCY